ncbi:hypothetical protein C2E23DRAFT_718956, partial [Lenzites betulinus]
MDLVWLKEYLNFTPSRPLWAYVADDLFASNVPPITSPASRALRVNPFLQHWKPLRKGLPPALIALLDVAKDAQLRLEGRAFTREIIRAMPMWDHAQADRTVIRRLGSRSTATACLRDTHRLCTVGDFETFAAEINDPAHEGHDDCECDRCTYLMAELGCACPHKCYERAERFLGALPPKWDPRGEHPCDFEDQMMADAIEAFPSEDGTPVPFDRRITVRGSLSNAFRVFEGRPVYDGHLPEVSVTDAGIPETAATDGSCLENGYSNATAGAGVFFGDQSPRNRSVRLPADLEQSNQTGEAVASLLAMQGSTRTAPL